MRNKILQVILDSVASINETLEDQLPISLGENCPLYGDSSTLDSIALVTLIVKVEQDIEDKFNVPIILASEKAMSRRNSPFLSIRTLTDYTVDLVKEEQNV
jgi:acyl carrier protein